MNKLAIGALIVLLLTGAIVKMNSAREPVATAASARTGTPPAFVLSIAKNIAANNGDPNPTQAQFVTTTRQTAEAADNGGQVDSNQSVYYIVLHGNFTAVNARVPRGASIPTGTVITLTVDPATQTVLDFSIGTKAPDLASLGAARDFTQALGGS